MGYLVGQKSGNSPAAATTIVFTAPTNAANDYILVFAAFRASGTISIAGSGAFTGIGTQAATGPYQNRWFYFKVSSPETTITITKTSTAVNGLYHCYVVRDVDGTTPIDVTTSITTGTAAAATLASPTPTTANANCLVLHGVVWDQADIINPPASVNVLLANQTSDAVGSMQSGVTFKSTAAALPSWNWTASNGTHGADAWSICLRNAGGGNRPMIVTDGRTVIRNYGGFDAPTFAAPSSVAATINGIACSATIGTVTAGKPLNSPWINNGASIASTESVTPTTWVGVWDTSVGTLDLTSKNIVVPLGRGTTFDNSRVGAEGIIIAFADASNNYVAYQLKTQVESLTSTYFLKFIRTGSTTAYASLGTPATVLGAVTKIGYFYQRISGASTTSINIYIGRIHYESSSSVIVGGNSSVPTTAYWLSAFAQAGGVFTQENSFQGGGQLVDKLSLTYGDGTIVCYTKHSGDSIEYPATSDADWLLGASSCTRTIKASSTDNVVLAGAIHRTIYREAFKIDAASSTSATYNFVGASFLGPWDFTDAAGCALASVLFNGCYKVSLAGATYTSLAIQNTIDTVAASITANATLLSCTTDATGTSASYHIETGTGVTALTLTDHTFTGSAATNKVHVLKTTGTVTITISGTTSLLAGEVTSAGATVVISAPVTYQSVTISNVVAGSRVQIYDTTNSVELCNGTSSNSASGSGKATGATVVSGSPATFVWTDDVAALTSGSRVIRVRISYVSGATAQGFIESTIGTCASSGSGVAVSYRANQSSDTVYDANAITGSGVTGVTFTDAATDKININVVANSISWKTIYAAWVYYAFGSTGIASDIDYIDAVDTANYILSNLIIKNTSSPTAPLEITGGYGVDAVTGATIDLADTTGGTLIFAPDHVVSYAVGSGVTAQDITDIAAASGTSAATAVLAAAATTPIHSDIRKVNSYTIDGDGQDATPWGPV